LLLREAQFFFSNPMRGMGLLLQPQVAVETRLPRCGARAKLV
jgi:hypothetical protein